MRTLVVAFAIAALAIPAVDNFQFAKTTEGWKIIALVDTRQRTGCSGQP